jgi:AraC family transcriptional regulator of adaptative response/methylated-DNA-[protein]-cysteine methyltransferase
MTAGRLEERTDEEQQMTDQSPAYHYQVIARALQLIEAEGPSLTLEALARRMSMSPAHFQRVFSQWVGISPKRYQQYLTLDLARRLLAERHTMLGTALAAGLSGTGRLHDLFLTWEAMSPGDYARRGAGLTIRRGWFETPFGQAIVMATDRGICGIGFADEIGADTALEDLAGRWPNAAHVEDPMALRPLVEAAFAGKATGLHLIGAPFQIKVWEALLAIPSGHVTTYADLAGAIGHPAAHRAVGTAVGRNPISFLIPCHRALRRDGGLGGYHWGLPRKRAMLTWEAARTEL